MGPGTCESVGILSKCVQVHMKLYYGKLRMKCQQEVMIWTIIIIR
jgi:hypothetical protein